MHLNTVNNDYFTMTPNTYHLNECYTVEIFCAQYLNATSQKEIKFW